MAGWTLPMHAVGMLTACGVAVALLSPWPLVIGAGGSILGLVASAAGTWTPSGRFGPANAVTAGRLLLLLLLVAFAHRLSSSVLAVGLLLALLLDMLDGFVARQGGHASMFGACFDMEVDAVFILFLGYMLWLRAGHGLWVLVPGLLRYVYVVTVVLVPPSGTDRVRSRLGRAAFVVTASCLLLAFAIEGFAARNALVAVGTMVACLSFGRSFYDAYPKLGKLLPNSARLAGRAWRVWGSVLLFLTAWSFLNVWVNLRFPASEPTGWYFLPSLDITVVVAVIAGLGLVGWRLPWGVRIPLVVWLVLVRLLRLGDGFAGQFFSRPFNLYTDLPLVPELVRFVHSTMLPWRFAAAAAAVVVAIIVVVFAVDRALTYLATHLDSRPQILAFALVAFPLLLASPFLNHDNRYVQRYQGAFGSSSLPRIAREATFLVNVYSQQAHEAKAIVSVQEVLHHTSAGLDHLHHANVLLLFVESYGASVIQRPLFAHRALPALRGVETDLANHGFSTASGLLSSSTYGGMSWLAHATLMTGVRTSNQMEYDLLGVHKPRSMARIFHEAGYRTVLLEPNTNRKASGAAFYDFDVTYSNWDFNYAGPAFAWASMPDQYVLDFTRRKVVDMSPGPLFATCVLVSSHAPWSHIPTLVPDWSQVGNGAIYHSYPFKRAYLDWSTFSLAAEPYLNSILYDLDVLRSYLIEFVHDDSLIIVLGDHQPVSEVTDNSPSWAVPIHVMSRDRDFVAPFSSRGYAHGMVPGNAILPMEDFLVDFLHDFSGGAS
ncbi:MAG TPA: CDP-alcohol phosphatidyltransferase family protein [Polyangia bacterium]